MNPAYQKIIASSEDDQRGLFVTAANRVGTTVQNIEKDFWVCWTLDALFHRLKAGGPPPGQAALSRANSDSKSKRSCAASSSGSQFVICGKIVL